MVTREEAYRHISKVPFRPFRVMLGDGGKLEVTRQFQAVVMPTELVVATELDRLRWIPLDTVVGIETVPVNNEA